MLLEMFLVFFYNFPKQDFLSNQHPSLCSIQKLNFVAWCYSKVKVKLTEVI